MDKNISKILASMPGLFMATPSGASNNVFMAMVRFSEGVRQAQEQREAEALYRAEVEPVLRTMGVRTDRDVEGPRMAGRDDA